MIERWQYTGEGLFSNIGGEVVILNLKTNNYYSLNSVATFVWELIEKKPSLPEIVEKVMEDFEVAQIECKKDIKEILDKLMELQLIETADIK